MNLGFWKKLRQERPQGIVVLAPMADVTDAAFRRVIAQHSRMGKPQGGPDALWTEFVSCDGLAFAPEEGRKKLLKDLIFTDTERPIVAQFFTSNPATMENAARIATELGFDGIDINMGCPDKSIEKQGAGAAMMKNPKVAQDVIRGAMKGTAEAAQKLGKEPLPISVKTRIGYTKNQLAEWLPAILETKPALVTIHARTRKEMSLVPARWEHVRESVAIRDQVQADISTEDRTLIFGNGDVKDCAEADQKVRETGADGVMIGRGIFGNPWLFDRNRYKKSADEAVGRLGGAIFEQPTMEEKLRVMVEHTKLYERLLGDTKNFAIMKKHYKAYVNGWDGAKELRLKLMETNNAEEVEAIVDEYLKKSH